MWLVRTVRALLNRPTIDQVPGIVYKVNCHDYTLIYVGESKHSWSSREAEHDPDRPSPLTDHSIHPRSDPRRTLCNKLPQEAFLGFVALNCGRHRRQRTETALSSGAHGLVARVVTNFKVAILKRVDALCTDKYHCL